MKTRLFICMLVILVAACKKEPTQANNTGTNSAPSGTAVKDATLTISISHDQRSCPPQSYAVEHIVGLGYSSTDLNSNTFFNEKKGLKSGSVYKFTLKPGTYYYKGRACCTNCSAQICNTFFSGNACKEQSGSLEVNSGGTYSKSISIF